MTTTNEQEKKLTSCIPTKLKGGDRPLREQLVDAKGRHYTQSLFLEIGYGSDAIYTLKDYDHEYNGELYLSIKKLFLEMEDVTEYEFANQYFAGWAHWKRICANKVLLREIEEWRYELELKLRARSVLEMKELAAGGSYQASKWLADKGWDVKPKGRPSKEDVAREMKVQADIRDEYSEDADRLKKVFSIGK